MQGAGQRSFSQEGERANVEHALLLHNTPITMPYTQVCCMQPKPTAQALYRFVGKSFGATPAQLGLLTLSRALVQALASPLAGILGGWAGGRAGGRAEAAQGTTEAERFNAVAHAFTPPLRAWQPAAWPAKAHATAQAPMLVPETICPSNFSTDFDQLVTLAGHYVNRIWVLTLGAALWGAMTCLFSFSTSVNEAGPGSKSTRHCSAGHLNASAS